MSAKLLLDTAAMAEDFFADTALTGIVCALPMYRFIWLMNEKLDMAFVRNPDMDIVLKIELKKNEKRDKNAAAKPKKDIMAESGEVQEYHFSVYQYCAPLNGCQHIMYQLRSNKEHLLPEVKQLDYLWLVQSATAEEDARLIAHHMRDIGEVQLAQLLSLDMLKNHNNLLV